jgi:hypothetical protein
MNREPVRSFITFPLEDMVLSGPIPVAFQNSPEYVNMRHRELERMIQDDERLYPPNEKK